jgi:hypothetical protein
MRLLNSFVEKHMRQLGERIYQPGSSETKTGADTPLIRRRTPRTVMMPASEEALHITCPEPTAEDAIRDKHFDKGQCWARQDRWDQLISAIEHADKARHMTPGTMPVAELLAFGARADVIHAAEHALMFGEPAQDAPLLEGIEALEHVLAEFPESFVVAAIVAQAHMDIAWAWRGTGWDKEIAQRNREAFEAHFDRARDILGGFCARELASPFLAGTCCALMGANNSDPKGMADKYEMLIDFNPANPRPMRALGNHLLPRWYGTYADLELEARRTAARTEKTWGAGGYTWVQFDAITGDDEACANLDLAFFVEGLQDILERHPDPYTVNLLAAYCANGIGQTFSGNKYADEIRTEIGLCTEWIVREYLTELHPMVWAHAARGFDNNLRVLSPARFAASGKNDALRIIMSLFSKEIAAGKRIVFTDTGPVAQT